MLDYTLVGVDGNAFSIMGYVKSVMKKERCSEEEISEYLNEAQSKDYNNLVSVSIEKLHEINARRRESRFHHEL